MLKKVRVLIVDDSMLFRDALSKGISRDPAIEVVGTASDPFDARDKILQLHPDVLTLDVEMPKMNGIDFLKKLIPQYPIAVVVVTSLPINAFEALNAGAVDFVNKPNVRSQEDMDLFMVELASKIRIASTAKVGIKHIHHAPVKASNFDQSQLSNMILAIGASTGGTDATQTVIQNLPETLPPLVITQHMPAGFTKMYAERLDRVSKITIQEAKDGDRLRPGLGFVAPGDFQMTVVKDLRGYYLKVAPGPKVSGHCPSVDVLFDSVADSAGRNAIGVILTGMGQDGAAGLLKMRKAGAYTIGQDEKSCVVYGMPMVAFNMGGVEKQASIDDIGNIIVNYLNLRSRHTGP